jgi:hypothetical protein
MVKYILKVTGFKTFEDMIKHIEGEKYKFRNYEILGHGYNDKYLHFYEVENE